MSDSESENEKRTIIVDDDSEVRILEFNLSFAWKNFDACIITHSCATEIVLFELQSDTILAAFEHKLSLLSLILYWEHFRNRSSRSTFLVVSVTKFVERRHERY